jgi:serine/threonine protein kinase
VVTSRTSAQSDVYSFGVVLLEIACGRKPVVPQEDEDKVLLAHWVWDMYGRGELLDAAHARLHDAGEFDVLEMERTLVVGLWCMHPDRASRPSIRQATNVLQFEVPLPELPLEMPVATY